MAGGKPWMMVRVAAVALLLASAAHAEAPAVGVIPTPVDAAAIPLRPAPATVREPEVWEQHGREGRAVRNVTAPTLTPVLPDPAKATGAAVIVAPGGAFLQLSVDSEGYLVARWLADHGVAAFVLKYRTQETPHDPKAAIGVMGARMRTAATTGSALDTPTEAVEDARAAIKLVRSRAAEWGVDPKRVGFVGFSAGAMTALSIGLAANAADRPDFIAPIYPPMSARPVPADAPPMFVAIALDDPLFGKGKDLGLIDSWRKAGRPIEAHLYERGGHGFGMTGRRAAPNLWPDEFYAWMKDRGLLGVGSPAAR